MRARVRGAKSPFPGNLGGWWLFSLSRQCEGFEPDLTSAQDQEYKTRVAYVAVLDNILSVSAGVRLAEGPRKCFIDEADSFLQQGFASMFPDSAVRPVDVFRYILGSWVGDRSGT